MQVRFVIKLVPISDVMSSACECLRYCSALVPPIMSCFSIIGGSAKDGGGLGIELLRRPLSRMQMMLKEGALDQKTCSHIVCATDHTVFKIVRKKCSWKYHDNCDLSRHQM